MHKVGTKPLKYNATTRYRCIAAALRAIWPPPQQQFTRHEPTALRACQNHMSQMNISHTSQ